MKLSEAMLLGDSLRRRTNEIYLQQDPEHEGEWCGCAVGGALLALGRGRARLGKPENNVDAKYSIWPWLVEPDLANYGRPFEGSVEHAENVASFENVMQGKNSFEQLVDYVRSIEPDCGECNQFQCTCQKQEVAQEQIAVTV
jgi:hypothetical protein